MDRLNTACNKLTNCMVIVLIVSALCIESLELNRGYNQLLLRKAPAVIQRRNLVPANLGQSSQSKPASNPSPIVASGPLTSYSQASQQAAPVVAAPQTVASKVDDSDDDFGDSMPEPSNNANNNTPDRSTKRPSSYGAWPRILKGFGLGAGKLG